MRAGYDRISKMDGAVCMGADNSTVLSRVHIVLLLLEGASLRFGLHPVLNAGWIWMYTVPERSG